MASDGTNAFNEARCPSCGRMHSWNGRVEDRTACPHCGYRLPEEKRKEAQAKFDALVKKSSKKKVVVRKSKGERKNIRKKKAVRRKSKNQ